MAEQKKEFIEVDTLGRQWLKQSLTTERARIVRLRNKEIAGSAIYDLRGKELEEIDKLLSRV